MCAIMFFFEKVCFKDETDSYQKSNWPRSLDSEQSKSQPNFRAIVKILKYSFTFIPSLV